jgi:hypothetical protein
VHAAFSAWVTDSLRYLPMMIAGRAQPLRHLAVLGETVAQTGCFRVPDTRHLPPTSFHEQRDAGERRSIHTCGFGAPRRSAS